MEAAKPKRKHKKKAKDTTSRSAEKHEEFQDSKGLNDLHYSTRALLCCETTIRLRHEIDDVISNLSS